MSTQQTNVNVTSIVRKTLSDQPVLCVRSTQTEIGVIGEALDEASHALERQDLASAGPPYTLFLESAGWEAGLPVDRAGVPEGRVVPAVLPGGEVASAFFKGNIWEWDNIEAVVANLRTQLEAADLEPAGPLRWIWLSDPAVTPNPDNHYTELHWPVTG
jgi:effector-binding domain-containing protein